jgi:hypothetical protein
MTTHGRPEADGIGAGAGLAGYDAADLAFVHHSISRPASWPDKGPSALGDALPWSPPPSFSSTSAWPGRSEPGPGGGASDGRGDLTDPVDQPISRQCTDLPGGHRAVAKDEEGRYPLYAVPGGDAG